MTRRNDLSAKRGHILRGHAPTWLIAGLALALAGCATTETAVPEPEVQAPVLTQQQLDHGLALSERAVEEERFDDAQKILQRIIHHDPENALAYYQLAELHLAMRDYKLAADEFGQMTVVPELSARSFQGRGLAQLSAGEREKAFTNLQKAVELDPTLVRSWNGLGYYYDLQEDWAASSENYSKALELDPKSAFVYNNRGYSYLMQGRYDDAIADLGMALRLDPELDLTKANLRLALAWKGNYALAMSGMREEEKAQVLNNIGFVALMRHDYRNAETYLMQAVESDPSLNQTARRNLALLRNLNEIEVARDAADQTAQTDEAIEILSGVPETMPAAGE